MKIVVAMDKFKGSLTALQACDAVKRGLAAVCPVGTSIVSMPMADGGDGTVSILLAGRADGETIRERVMDPLGREIDAVYGWFAATQWAVVEMARASGLNLLRPVEFDPMRTSTYGTGQLMLAAIERGAKKVSLAIGGSATVDGGVGAAMAMGWKFLDAQGNPVGLGGGALGRIVKLVPPSDRSSWPVIEVWCDVVNPLCGPNGAALVYGPQKGATSTMVPRLDAGLRHLSRLVQDQLGIDMADVPGAGAAGGLAAGAMAFFGARLISGIDAIMDVTGFGDAARGADWVVTGEGRFDAQSLQGKVVTGMVNVARQHGARVLVLAGDRENVTDDQLSAAGIDQVVVVRPSGMTLEAAIHLAEPLLEGTARDWAARNVCAVRPYEFFEHTADIGVRIRGATLAELFRHAALALYEAMGQFRLSDRVEEKIIEVEAAGLDDVLRDWLGELLYEVEARGCWFDRVEIEKVEPGRLMARVSGGPIDFERSLTHEEIKAVTYHQLKVEQQADGAWMATVIFDV